MGCQRKYPFGVVADIHPRVRAIAKIMRTPRMGSALSVQRLLGWFAVRLNAEDGMSA